MVVNVLEKNGFHITLLSVSLIGLTFIKNIELLNCPNVAKAEEMNDLQ
jgi:hypothetical protein